MEIPEHNFDFSVQRMELGKWKKWPGKTKNGITFGYALHWLKEMTKLGSMCRIVRDSDGAVIADNGDVVLSPESLAFCGVVNDYIDGLRKENR